MINSILNRKPRRITLDYLTITHDDNTEELTLDPDLIEQHTINHFQNLGNITEDDHFPADSHHDLPGEWADIYTPKNHIQNEWFNSITNPITIKELQDTLSTLPNNKASGPSFITYEDIKHIDSYTKQFLVEFFNLMLTHHIYPNEWNDALLFPIPKPKDWNCQINNTRPIVLPHQTYNRTLQFEQSTKPMDRSSRPF
ncbi:hypothetical protein C1645_837044 [Glomus cerebriforme]|uniref:Reverse transcriptase domain-containing protein n=1 Tax=Glomus cerebriforme TaxID=658196 RepID=A0A397SBN9_9GLOM|nr:hypothetical protein C1645_837044 [Glomus cerebriforme]